MMRKIGKADVEFYQGYLVLHLARTIGVKPYDTLSYRARQKRLNTAVDIVHSLLNDEEAVKELREYTRIAY